MIFSDAMPIASTALVEAVPAVTMKSAFEKIAERILRINKFLKRWESVVDS
jgi:hypothetical protein